MKIKKFEGRTEQEVIENVKQELGLDALILNIKTTKPRGFFAFMRHQRVEVTAAYDDKKPRQSILAATAGLAPSAVSLAGGGVLAASRPGQADMALTQALGGGSAGVVCLQPAHASGRVEKKAAHQAATGNKPDEASLQAQKRVNQQNEKIRQLEAKLVSAEDLLASTMQKLTVAQYTHSSTSRRYENNLLQIFYATLTEQGVLSDIAEELLSEAMQLADSGELNVDLVVKVVYNRIIKLLGSAQLPDLKEVRKGRPAVITFIGPTGVGKTTTIAKISSMFILKEGRRVGLITADTYRIAAVEQLRTYSEILSAPMITAYNKADMGEAVELLSVDCEVIIVDTAGRSHKHRENIQELGDLLTSVPGATKYLVLSATTKSEDILSIIELYKDISDFHLIFTKLDETNCLGAILNACYLTGKKISYITNGQNVPDDIEIMQPEKIAKALMGLGAF